AGGSGNAESLVGAEGIKNDDVVAPFNGFETSGKIFVLVQSEDENGDHGTSLSLTPTFRWVWPRSRTRRFHRLCVWNSSDEFQTQSRWKVFSWQAPCTHLKVGVNERDL